MQGEGVASGSLRTACMRISSHGNSSTVSELDDLHSTLLFINGWAWIKVEGKWRWEGERGEYRRYESTKGKVLASQNQLTLTLRLLTSEQRYLRKLLEHDFRRHGAQFTSEGSGNRRSFLSKMYLNSPVCLQCAGQGGFTCFWFVCSSWGWYLLFFCWFSRIATREV